MRKLLALWSFWLAAFLNLLLVVVELGLVAVGSNRRIDPYLFEHVQAISLTMLGPIGGYIGTSAYETIKGRKSQNEHPTGFSGDQGSSSVDH
jgi:hypothetical protein